MFSLVPIPIYIPTNSVWGFPFFQILPNTYLFLCFVFDNSYSNRCEVISHCGFNLNFLNDE